MPARPRLAAIPSLESAVFSDSVYRAIRKALRDKILSTEGNRYYAGRYHAAGETGVLYTSLDPDVAVRELGRHASRRAVQDNIVIGRIYVRLQRVLDLTDTGILARLDLSKNALTSPDWSITQAISLQARKTGIQGLLVPAATGGGVNLVVFENNLGVGCLIEIEEVRML